MEIRLEHVNYVVNKGTQMQKKIVNDLDLTIKGNTITAFIGEPGAGKSTILELIGALIRPSSGHITIGSNRITSKRSSMDNSKFRSYIGIVCQKPENQFFCNTVEKEMEFALKNFNFNLDSRKKRISDSLKMVGLDDSYLDRNPRKLSKGEQRRLALAVCLSFNPKIIILDEVSMDLDSAGRKHLIKLIRMMKIRYKKTIVLSSCDSDLVHAIADDIYVVSSGRVIFHGDKYQVFTNNELLSKGRISVPKLIEFSNIVMQRKQINIGYRDDINDLMKDIYRYVK